MAPMMLLLALTGGEAQAFYHTFRVWPRENFPVLWYIFDIVTASPRRTRRISQESSTPGPSRPCADPTNEYGGAEGYADGYYNDDIYTISFEDPGSTTWGDLPARPSAGPSDQVAFTREGQRLHHGLRHRLHDYVD